ncbi:MAG: phosphatidylinositol-specific phospholipase C/glycerophosphodiester phosphodiesterase family protein [Rubripirellula sp.]
MKTPIKSPPPHLSLRFSGITLSDWLYGAAAIVIMLGCSDLAPARADETAASAVPLKQAHAHNDYLHQRPLLDALDHGFCSVEADIFLVDGELLVAHSRSELSKERTLKKLYLDPLSERVNQNGGRVYRDGPVITLLIDFKNDGIATYKALDKLLGQYPNVFSVTNDGVRTEKAVNVVISGDRPFATVQADTERFAGLDGRLSDLDSNLSVDLMPMISDRWGSHFKWKGKGEMTSAEMDKLDAIVEQAHAKGRILRFWGIPDNPTSWKAMQKAGVDLINTDDLDGLSKTLKE